MHVDMRLPAEWDVVVASDGAVRATSPLAPDLEIVAAPLTPTHEAKAQWALLVAREQLGLPANASDQHIAVYANEKGTTVDGWPAWYIVAERIADERPSELRVFGFYFFLDYSAYAQILGPAARQHIDLLRRARPNYGVDEVVALEQLWR